MRKSGQLMVGVGVLALAVGVLAGRLLGSKDDGHGQQWTPAARQPDGRAGPHGATGPDGRTAPLDPLVSMGMPAVTDTQTPADSQVPHGAPAARQPD